VAGIDYFCTKTHGMICFPNAKINLGLSVTHRRPDGFHDLETCFYPIPLFDVLEFVESTTFSLTIYGQPVPGSIHDNLLTRVWELLNKVYHIPPLKVALLKNIPMGAGLGGGSADAAFFLRELNNFFNLALTNQKLRQLALSLGSDCPFFIRNTPVVARGRGELMTDCAVSLSGFWLTVISPSFFIPTSEAFRQIVPKTPKLPIADILSKHPGEWHGLLVNDFQSSAIRMFPVIGQIIGELEGAGALYVSLTGSGSSVYALSENPLLLPESCSEHRIFSRKLSTNNL